MASSSSRGVATLITGSFSLALVSHFVLLLLLIDGKRQVHASSPQRLLNYCLDSKYHKSQPSSEPMLKDQVSVLGHCKMMQHFLNTVLHSVALGLRTLAARQT